MRNNTNLTGPVINDNETRDFIKLIYEHSGIVLTIKKRSLISSRLHKRLQALGLDTFREYFDYLQFGADREDEIVAMVDEMTTNKTAFFRENYHFDYLISTILPALPKSQWSMLNVWSAGCSTGEEPYTLAMVLAEYYGSARAFSIVATDLSTQALHAAKTGVYSNAVGSSIPVALRKKYTMTGRGSQTGRFRIVPELRERVTFKQTNLIHRDWDVASDLNIIFCRNVMIYFDQATRAEIIGGFWRKLKAGGNLFIGHSETLGDIDHRFIQVQPTVYAKER